MKHFLSLRFLALVSVLLLLALWYAGVAWMTDRGVRRVEDATTLSPPSPDPAESWRVRRFFIDPDSYCWLSMARDLRASHHIRVRQTLIDNAPYGREVHWAQLLIWMLAGLSWALERAAGVAPPLALELAGRILMPAVGFLFSAWVFLFLARRRRLFFAFLAAVPMAVCTQNDFHTMRPDHHGFQISFIIAALLYLLDGGMGWQRAGPPEGRACGDDLPSHRAARRHFILAGVFSGLALWLGAMVFAYAMLAMTVGMALALGRASARDGEEAGAVLCPDLFRWWGVSGAATSLGFYLVEYAPFHFSMCLGANHPVYALWFLGTTECLRALARWKQDRASFGWKDGFPAAAGCLAAAVLPALNFFGPEEWILPRSPIMLRLFDRLIVECRPLWETGLWGEHFVNIPLLLAGGVAGVLSAVILRRKRISFSRRAPLLLLGLVTLSLFLLSCWLVRWVQFLHPCLVLLVAFGWAAVCDNRCPSTSTRGGRWGCVLAGLLALAPTVHMAAGQLRSIWYLNRVEQMNDMWVKMLLQRNLMLQLKAAVPPDRPLRLMLPVEMAPAAYYFETGSSVGSLYWENVEGMKATAEFFGDPLPGARAYQIAGKRAITHVMVDVEHGEADAFAFYYLLTGKSDYPSVADTVGHALAMEESLESDWLHLDERLSAMASQPYYVFMPKVARWVPFRLPLRLRVYRVDEGAFPKVAQ
jgi:hypothetical protein